MNYFKKHHIILIMPLLKTQLYFSQKRSDHQFLIQLESRVKFDWIALDHVHISPKPTAWPLASKLDYMIEILNIVIFSV